LYGVLPWGAGLRALVLGLMLLGGVAHAQTLLPGEAAKPGDRDTGGVRPPTEKLEHGRIVFVQSSCHFCHGPDLTQAQMGAADLMHDQLVPMDVDGNIIGAVVKAGLPNLQTSMPSFPDLTVTQISDLAAYVHYLRQVGRLKEAMASTQAGDAVAGKAFFEGAGGCATCHTDVKTVAGAGKAKMLMPASAVPKEGVVPSAGGLAHQHLLETATVAQWNDVAAYMGTLK
jgi:mono/diheme cytochrome c family protein